MASRPPPLTPEQFTQSLWYDVNALEDMISMAEGNRFSPRAKSFAEEIGHGTVNSIDAIGQLTANMTDEEFVILKRLVEKRSREAAQVTATPVSTVQHCIPRSLNPEMPSEVCINLESNEGKMDPEMVELESPSAGTGFKTSGQQCHPIWETERTTADGFLTAGVGSNKGGDNSSPTERVGMRAGIKSTTTHADILKPTEHGGTQAGTASNTVSLRTKSKPQDKKTFSEENKQFDPGGEGGKQPPPWDAAVMVAFSFPGGSAGPRVPVVCALCSFPFWSVLYLFLLSGDHFSAP